jgi:hypothetical protein
MLLLEYDLFGCPIVTHFGFHSSRLDLGSLSLFHLFPLCGCCVGLAFQGKDIVFSFIIEYSSLWDFGL